MFGSGGHKIKIDDVVYQKLKVAAGILGCEVDELAAKVLTREAEQIMAQTSSKEPTAEEVDEIANRLKGLGYLE